MTVNRPTAVVAVKSFKSVSFTRKAHGSWTCIEVSSASVTDVCEIANSCDDESRITGSSKSQIDIGMEKLFHNPEV